MNKKQIKESGIMLPIFSLPNKYGIGTFGKEAYAFIDFLKATNQSYWQILPLVNTSFGDSPYQSISTYALNINFMDLDYLQELSLLNKEELDKCLNSDKYINYDYLFKTRLNILRIAFNRFINNLDKYKMLYLEFQDFIKDNKDWLEDYSLFYALKREFNYQSFLTWPKAYKNKESLEVKTYQEHNNKELLFHQFNQFMLFKMWFKLKNYANSLGIKIIGDLPIYVSSDSADVFSHKEVFLLDEDFYPTLCAGVPPDYFSKLGQLWGNPIYDYEYLEKTNYQWMIDRIKHYLNLYDIIRLDHFRAYASYYVIDKDAPNAINGKWVEGPRMKLFKALKKAIKGVLDINNIRMIAEDLGILTDDVFQLLKDTHLLGMKVAQFGLLEKDSLNNPSNYLRNVVAYPGTHDNDTVLGWYNSLDLKNQEYLLKSLKASEACIVDKIIQKVLKSRAKIAIVSLTDYMHLDTDARINEPSTVSNGEKHNWGFRLNEDYLSDQKLKERIIKHNLKSNRKPNN